MKDVNHLIAVLRDLTQLGDLDLSPEGHAELVFDPNLSVSLVKVDDTRIELSSPLDHFDRFDAAMLRRLLEANYHGDATGAARLALHPVEGGLLICERIDVTTLEPHQVETRVLDFVKHALFWNDDAAQRLIAGTPAASNSEPAWSSETMIRI